MTLCMTTFTDRNNVKPVFLCVSFVVMILLCLMTTRALQSVGWGQFTPTDCISDCLSGFNALWESTFVSFSSSSTYSYALFAPNIAFFCNLASLAFFVTFSSSFAFFATIISPLNGLARLCLEVLFSACTVAYFASVSISIFRITVYVKFRKRFDLLTSATSFCHDLHSHYHSLSYHCRFSKKRYWLESNALPVRVFDSSNYTTTRGACQ